MCWLDLSHVEYCIYMYIAFTFTLYLHLHCIFFAHI